ncbi:MAG: 16S rRNA (adenine(1518)-N(6)/adenine(1519)-N(6))-dimethyltransferase RsmA [Gammaproteobacteria bacterium]|nr:16S rRNA (adenine(1518)-N(6)/adenine(1519)-N(6))-dimethyltransferase RsmA [Gammaproteobacteria bacterium]
MKHQARKRFGQNFLHDPAVIQRIVSSITPRPDDCMVEIGPGMGAITRSLLEACGELDVVEIDRDLIPILETELAGLGKLTVHNVDALKFDFRTLQRDECKLRVVGNLPYNISTPLVFRLISQIEAIKDMHFMLQKEVVDRMIARPDSSDYGRLSVMCQYHCTTEKLFVVSPGAFNPRPKVDSAIVRLIPHPRIELVADDYIEFSRMVNHCFTQRRKTLRNNLKNLLPAEHIEELGIDPGTRAETLTVNLFVQLANSITALKRSV